MLRVTRSMIKKGSEMWVTARGTVWVCQCSWEPGGRVRPLEFHGERGFVFFSIKFIHLGASSRLLARTLILSFFREHPKCDIPTVALVVVSWITLRRFKALNQPFGHDSFTCLFLN